MSAKEKVIKTTLKTLLGGLLVFTIATLGTINQVSAYGEKYSWVSANEIHATGGNFGSNTAVFNVTKKYNTGKDNIPTFQTEDIGVKDKNGCIINATLTFRGKDAGFADFEIIADLASGLSCTDYADKIKTYDKKVALSNTDKQGSSVATDRTITVKTQVPKEDGASYAADKITIKETRGDGAILSTKNVKISDKKDTGTDYVGFEVKFNNLSPSLGYTICSEYIDKCEGAGAIPSAAGPIEAITGNSVTIKKERVSGDDSTTSCAIDGVGWLVCPVVTFIGLLNDALYAVIKQFLEIQPSMFKADSDTYRAWSVIRNIANIAFVIAFLIIIYSQMTGAGISNYGIKKMMPKLIIAAILVNVSFWICAIAVDISNILGSGLYNLLQEAIGGSSTNTDLGSPVNSWSDVIVWVLSGGAIAGAGIAAAITVGSVGFFGALSLLLPGAIVVLLAFFTVVVMLIARQALIILLVVIAPLAFVAYLLPNTDQWFQRWRKFLTTLLIMYPSIALLFGGSELAAAVIRAADPENAWLVIGSLVVTALPLFALPALMKAAGGIMNRIGGIVNNPNRGPLDRMKKGAQGYRERKQNENKGAALAGTRRWGRRTFRRAERRQLRASAAEAAAKAGADEFGVTDAKAASIIRRKDISAGRSTAAAREHQSQLNEAIRGDIELQAQIGGIDPHGARRAAAAAKAAMDKELNELVTHEKSTMSALGPDELFRMMKDTSQTQERRMAAAGMIMKNGGDQHIHEALDYLGTADATTDSMIGDIQQQVAADIGGRKPFAYGETAITDLSRGAFGQAGGKPAVSYDSSLLSRINSGKVSAADLAKMSADELARVAHVINTRGNEINATSMDGIISAIREVNTNDNLKGAVASDQKQALLNGIANGTGVPPEAKISLDHPNFDRP